MDTLFLPEAATLLPVYRSHPQQASIVGVNRRHVACSMWRAEEHKLMVNHAFSMAVCRYVHSRLFARVAGICHSANGLHDPRKLLKSLRLDLLFMHACTFLCLQLKWRKLYRRAEAPHSSFLLIGTAPFCVCFTIRAFILFLVSNCAARLPDPVSLLCIYIDSDTLFTMVFALNYRRPSHVSSARASLDGDEKQASINESIVSGSSASSNGIPEALSFDHIINGGVCPVSQPDLLVSVACD